MRGFERLSEARLEARSGRFLESVGSAVIISYVGILDAASVWSRRMHRLLLRSATQTLINHSWPYGMPAKRFVHYKPQYLLHPSRTMYHSSSSDAREIGHGTSIAAGPGCGAKGTGL